MPSRTPSDFDHLLDERLAGIERPGAAPTDTATSPNVRHALFGVQESWKEAGAASAADLAQLYEADGRPAPAATPLLGTDLDMVAAELGLTSDLTLADLNRIRRDFALANHPDRVPAALSEHANRRMTAANTLIDQALKRKRNQAA
jgi:hypothetical protein